MKKHLPGPPTVALIGPFGYGNLGDAATQDALIQEIRRRVPGVELRGFSLNPADTQARHGIPSFPISRMSWAGGRGGRWSRATGWLESRRLKPLRMLGRVLARAPMELGLVVSSYRSLRGVDLLLISGGGQLDDYWGGGGPWSHPYTLLKFALLTRLRGGRVAVTSVGAGPLNSWLSRRFTRWTLGLAAYRSYRDEASRDLIEQIGGPRGDSVAPDLAHGLDVAAYRGATTGRPSSRLTVGVGPVGYFRDGSWPEADAGVYARYRQNILEFVTWLLANGHGVRFLTGEAHYDQKVVEETVEHLVRAGVSWTDGQLDDAALREVGDLVRAIDATDVVVASRFHNVLLAQRLGKPVVALSYQSKIDSLMAATGQSPYCLPIEGFDSRQLADRLQAASRDRAAIVRTVDERLAAFDEALREQYDRVFAELLPATGGQAAAHRANLPGPAREQAVEVLSRAYEAPQRPDFARPSGPRQE